MSEWKECKLGEHVFINSRSVDKNYQYKEIEYLDTGSITRGKIESLQRFKLADAPSRAKRIVKDNDIVLSMVRPIQRHYGYLRNTQPNTVVSTGFVVLTNKESIDPYFLYSFLTQDDTTEYLDVVAEGSTSAYPAFTPDVVENLSILLPPLPEQRAIAGVLSSLDDKIDLLHRQNKTLEGMAEALWRKMFVEEADPRWKKGKLGDYLQIQGGYAFKSSDFRDSGEIRIIKITNISDGLVDIVNTQFVDRKNVDNLDWKFKIITGSILIAMTGAEIGKIGIVEKTDKEIWLNQRVGMFRETKKYGNLLGFLALNSDEGQEHILSSATGSAQANISSTGIEDFEMPIVPDSILYAFGIAVQPFFERICFNLGQIHTVSRLRDALLPKLMSGEVRVKL